MKPYKVSIVVAVYNLEEYLPRCLDALVNQTLQEIEILCVDDGSTDSAPQIVDEYVAKYPDKTILVAAHDAVNKAIICDVLGLGMEHFWQIKQDNTCINVLECNEGVWRTVLLNSTNHMGFLFSGIEQAGL